MVHSKSHGYYQHKPLGSPMPSRVLAGALYVPMHVELRVSLQSATSGLRSRIRPGFRR